MREIKPFGKRSVISRKLPDSKNLKEIFGVTNNGCDSKQIINFVNKSTKQELIKEKKK